MVDDGAYDWLANFGGNINSDGSCRFVSEPAVECGSDEGATTGRA